MSFRAAVSVGALALMVVGAPCAQAAQACMRVKREIPAQTVLAAADFVRADCGADPARATFRYDAPARVVRTTRNLREGEVVAGVPTFALAGVRPGEKVFVQARVGPVLVQREAEAIQPARKGQSLFVRTSDGAVFSVPFPKDAQ